MRMAGFLRLVPVADFKNAEKEDDIDQAGKEQRYDKRPMPGLNGALKQIPLAEKPA